MKKADTKRPEDLRKEYKRSDFGKMVRGKYARRIALSSNVVLLDPEVAKTFPNDEAVNEALRSLINLAKASTRTSRRPKARTAKSAA